MARTPCLVTTEEMRALDQQTMLDIGLPGMVLMENAGRAVAEEVARMTVPGSRVAVVCGSGNNGGDGAVCARWLHTWGRLPTVYQAAGRPALGSDAARHLAVYEKCGGAIEDIGNATALASRSENILGAEVIVDALFGTGLTRMVDGHAAAVIDLINTSPSLRVAIDVPSGLDATTGHRWGKAVHAHCTVTLAFAKVGLVTSPGFEFVGDLKIADIGIPQVLADQLGVKTWLLDHATVAAMIPTPSPMAHKGNLGHVLVIAGSLGKTGAAVLCAQAAQRSGAGLVTLATLPSAQASMETRVREVMTAAWDQEAPVAMGLKTLAVLLTGKKALAWGPGISTDPRAGELLRAALTAVGSTPAVFDADALNHLVGYVHELRKVRAVLTPHPGEAARLLAMKTEDVQADRVGSARRLAQESSAVVVLKGARTVIAAPDGRTAINPTGNVGMASGGTGDVLTGIIAALLAGSLDPFAAACVGAYVHGQAGDLAQTKQGTRGMIAGDIIDMLPQAWNMRV